MQRLAFNLALVISLLFLPWWAGAVLALCACFMVPSFYEVVVYGILCDALYSTRYGVHGFEYLATLYTIAIISVASAVRNKLAW